jgi:hypothetical protein
MKIAKYYKTLFLIAALWNLGAGILCWAGCVFMPDMFFKMFGMPVPTSLFPFHAMFWFIIAFGIGYWRVSCDITKNHGIIFIGLIAKILFCIDCIITIVSKEANIMLLGTGIIDLIFAGLFIEFSLRAKKGPIQTIA